MQTLDTATWLPHTKLTPPRIHADVIVRPRLQEMLRDAIATYPLTLVTAPTGYGKTTLLTILSRATPLRLVAWLSLDEHDNDPILFLSGLIAALQRVYPDCGQMAQTMLQSLGSAASPDTRATIPRVLGALINDLLSLPTEITALVLDDLHLISEPAIYAALNYLIDRLPPHLHLVLATRHDPPLALALLRARGLLKEVRLQDLSFTHDETSALLNDQFGLNLAADELAMLQDRTEGWVAGLRLLAGSLTPDRNHADRRAWITYVAQTHRAITDVLVDEVLNREHPVVRSFLLDTAILDELTPQLCRAVTGRDDAEAMLEDLYRRNLFIVELDATHSPLISQDAPVQPPSASLPPHFLVPDSRLPTPTYRYHALFASFLRQRLSREASPERVIELHRRAAQSAPTPARAINHYLAAGLWDEAVEHIESIGGITLRQGLQRTVQSWIGALPTEVYQTRPRLLYLLGVCAWQQGDLSSAETMLERARQGFAAIGDAVGQGEALIDLSVPLFFRGDLARGSALVEEAMQLPLRLRSRIHALVNRCGVNLLYERRDLAEQDSSAIFALISQSDDPEALNIVLTATQPVSSTLIGSLDRLEPFLRGALALPGEQFSLARVGAASALATLQGLRGRLEESYQTGVQTIRMSEQLGGYLYIDAELDIFMAQLCAARGDFNQAEQFFARGFDATRRIGLTDVMMTGHLYVLGRVRWQQGHLREVRQLYERMHTITRPDELPLAAFIRGLMGGLLAIAEQRYAEARQILHAAAAQEFAVCTAVLYGSAYPLLAHLTTLEQRPAEAAAELAPWLAWCEQYAIPGRILLEGPYVVPLLQLAVEHDIHADFSARSLHVLGPDEAPTHLPRRTIFPSETVPIPRTGETLTAREVEVLRLLATGASNKEIAEQLVIGEQTVKTHVAHILRKLDATSRTQAVAQAYALGIMDKG